MLLNVGIFLLLIDPCIRVTFGLFLLLIGLVFFVTFGLFIQLISRVPISESTSVHQET